MKKILVTIALLLLAQSANAQFRLFQPTQGGTGIGSADAGDVGTCLKVSDNSPFTFELGTCGGAGGQGVATSTPIADNYIAVGTSINDVGFYSNFTFDNVANLFTFPNASGTQQTLSDTLFLNENIQSVNGATGLNIIPGTGGFVNIGDPTYTNAYLYVEEPGVGFDAEIYGNDLAIYANNFNDYLHFTSGAVVGYGTNSLQWSSGGDVIFNSGNELKFSDGGSSLILDVSSPTQNRTLYVPDDDGYFGLLPFSTLASGAIPFGDGTATFATSTGFTYDSSLSRLTATNSSSTLKTISGSLWLPSLTSELLKVDANGLVQEAVVGTDYWGVADKILIVDPDGNGAYTTIASAITAASSGDLIYVSPGTYSEGTLAIPTGVEVVCSAPDTTIIESTSATGVTVADNSTLRNCTLQTLATDATAIKSATGEASEVVIEGNTIISSRYGIFSDNTDYFATSTISNNRFEITATSSNLAAALTIHNNSVAPTVIQSNEIYLNRTAGTGDTTGIQFPGSNLGEDKQTDVIGNTFYVVSNGSGETNGWEVSGGGQRYFTGNTFDVVNTGTGTTTAVNDWGTNVGEHNVYSNGNIYRVRSGSGNAVALWEHNQSGEDTKNFSGDTFESSSVSGVAWDIYYDPQILAGQAQIVNSSYDPTKVFQKSTQNFLRTKVGITSQASLTTAQITALGKNAGDTFFDTTIGGFQGYDGVQTVTFATSSSGGGAVDSVSNSDGTLTISPTTGAVVASLNLAKENTWTEPQTFSSTTVSAYFAEKIAHQGEATNFIQFAPSTQKFSIGGITFLDWNTSGFTPSINFNPNQSNIDYRFETSSSAQSLFILDSNGFVGIGDATPSVALDVTGSGAFSNDLTVTDLLTTANGSSTLWANSGSFWLPSLTSELLKVDANGLVQEAVSGTDYEVPITAGDALTRTGNDIDFDGGATPGGSLGGSWASPTIDDLFLLLAGDSSSGDYVFTGLIDIGGGVLEIPNGLDPIANDPGELSHDTTDNQLILDDFVVARATKKIWSTTVASTSPAFIDSALLPIPTQLDGYTMTAIRCKVDSGTSKVIAIEDASANSTEDITCATTVTSDDGTITNATATAAEEMYIDFGATSGAVDYVTISVFGTITRE